ncbi:MAG TPA: carboxypeptidase-like regulatory domain-containing protein [Planctomycetota bacterium]|nr:carboxypeptidase-like regulatory domain-containing protein [Planctomycetota bacterium]
MARSRLAAGVVLVAAVSVGGWLWLTRSSAGADHLSVLSAAPGAPQASSRLERPLRVRGLVVDSAAQPLADAVVQIAQQAGPAAGLPTKVAHTDAAGAFEFEGLGRGTWTIWGNADGFVGRASGSLELVDQDLGGVALRLVRGATIKGSARTSRGEVIPDARVAAWLVTALARVDRPVPEASVVIEAGAPEQRVEVRTEAGGAYMLGPLAPGEYMVAAALPSDDDIGARVREAATRPPPDMRLPAGMLRVAVAAGANRTLDLLLPRPARVSGVVRAGGAPAAGARVALATGSSQRWTLVRAVDTEAAGGFEIDDLPPLEGLVVACAPGELLPRLKRVDVAEGADVVVELSFDGPGLAGTVVDVTTRQAVPGVPVQAQLVKAAEASANPWAVLGAGWHKLMSAAGLRAATVTTDAAGRFTLSHLVAGSWSATASGNGWLTDGAVAFDVKADWTSKDIEVPVKAGAVVEGSVRWTLAGPADSEVEVGLYKPQENTVWRFVRASHGTYKLDGLKPGDYELRVRHMVGGGGVVHAEPVTLAEGQHITIDLVLDD